MANPDTLVLTLNFAEIAAGTDEAWYLPIPLDETYRLSAVYFTSMTARTANDTNYTTITVQTGATVIATQTTKITGGSGDLVAGTAIAIPVTGTGKNLEFSLGDSIGILKTDAASGLALDGTFALVLTAIRA